MQAAVNIKTFVEAGVVDVAFPANRGAGFFKVNAHHQLKRVAIFGELILKELRVFQGGFFVVDGAGADYDQQTVVTAMDDGVGLGAGLGDESDFAFAGAEVADDDLRGDEAPDFGNADVVGGNFGGHGSNGAGKTKRRPARDRAAQGTEVFGQRAAAFKRKTGDAHGAHAALAGRRRPVHTRRSIRRALQARHPSSHD